MDINGCSSDWEYGEQTLKNKCMALLIEVGTASDNFWPPLGRIHDLVSENLQPNIILAHFADNLFCIFPPNTPSLYFPPAVSGDEYHINWTFSDPHNVAQFYELFEYEYRKNITDRAILLDQYDFYGFTVSDARYHSAPTSFFSGAANNNIRYIHSNSTHVVESGETLELWTYYGIQEGYDYAYVEVSLDGINYIPLEGNITTNYNPNGLNRGNGITGSSGGWIQASFDLADYMGQAVYIGFSYYTDAAYTGEGIYIDDMYPMNGFISETCISSTITDKFYTFTDKRDGVYYYKVRVMDAEGQWSPFSNLKGVTVINPFMCGDTDGDETINILDIVYLINFLYKSGPVPEPADAADVNNDEALNILDIVYLINFIYKNGAEPNCP